MPFRPDYLRDLREAKNWSQQELSKRSRVGQSVIAKSERGQNSPGSDVLDRLAEALDCTIDYLLGRGPNYANPGTAAANMAFDAFVLRIPITKQQEDRCRRALQHIDAPKTAAAWRSFAEMVELAVGPAEAGLFDRTEVIPPPKPQPMPVTKQHHNYRR